MKEVLDSGVIDYGRSLSNKEREHLKELLSRDARKRIGHIKAAEEEDDTDRKMRNMKKLSVVLAIAIARGIPLTLEKKKRRR